MRRMVTALVVLLTAGTLQAGVVISDAYHDAYVYDGSSGLDGDQYTTSIASPTSENLYATVADGSASTDLTRSPTTLDVTLTQQRPSSLYSFAQGSGWDTFTVDTLTSYTVSGTYSMIGAGTISLAASLYDVTTDSYLFDNSQTSVKTAALPNQTFTLGADRRRRLVSRRLPDRHASTGARIPVQLQRLHPKLSRRRGGRFRNRTCLAQDEPGARALYRNPVDRVVAVGRRQRRGPVAAEACGVAHETAGRLKQTTVGKSGLVARVRQYDVLHLPVPDGDVYRLDRSCLGHHESQDGVLAGRQRLEVLCRRPPHRLLRRGRN